ncbi:MAG: GAF domain-containing protein, partial [bacterium]
MSESPAFQIILLVFLAIGSFLLLLVPFSSHLVYRLILILFLGGGGVFLYPTLAVIPGILAIPADYIFLLYNDGSVTAVEPLFWAGFLLIPYFASLGLEKYKSGRKTEYDSPDKKNMNSPAGEKKDPLPFPKDSPGDEDPTYRLQKLVTGFFERAQRSLGFSNLFYFHVHSTKAIPGYLINGAGKIDEDIEFTPDVGQGVGWVLRHGERLTLPQNQIDWRNLQYHRQPVDLKRIIIEPVEQKGDLIGIIA